MEASRYTPERDPNGSIFILGLGSRVQAHPACDCWMMGDRYGTVVKITKKSIHVKMDVSDKTRRFKKDLLLPTKVGLLESLLSSVLG